MNSFTVFVIVLLNFFIIISAAGAQEKRSLATGDLVRITIINEKIAIIGRVVSVRTNALIVRRKGQADDSIYPLNYIEIELNTRKYSAATVGYGSLIGFSIGAIYGFFNEMASWELFGPEPHLGRATLVGGAGGAIAGGIIGAFVGKEKWEEIPIENIRSMKTNFQFSGMKLTYSVSLPRLNPFKY